MVLLRQLTGPGIAPAARNPGPHRPAWKDSLTVEAAPEKPMSTDANQPRPRIDPDIEPLALVCLGWVPWGQSWKRNQSMVYQLSRRPLFDRTVFINPKALWIGDQFRAGEGSLGVRFHRVMDSLPRNYGGTIKICSQWHFVPFKGRFDAGQKFEDWVFRRMLRSFTGNRRFVLLINHPNFSSPDVLGELMGEAALNIFDMSDDFVEFFTEESHREHFRRNIEYCCTNSDLVFTVNEHVAEKYGPHNPNTIVVPNSTNFSNFHRRVFRPIPWLEKIRRSGNPVLGCTGIINRVRIDYELLEDMVTRRPQWQFVFIGNADPSFLDIVLRHDNVHRHTQVPYDELPDWINYFDAAIIPFRINEHTRGNDLLKFHDYLAMGKSIVTTRTAGAWRFEGLIHVADETRGFLECTEDALGPVSEELRQKRVDMARRNSWNSRAGEIESILRDHLEGRA